MLFQDIIVLFHIDYIYKISSHHNATSTSNITMNSRGTSSIATFDSGMFSRLRFFILLLQLCISQEERFSLFKQFPIYQMIMYIICVILNLTELRCTSDTINKYSNHVVKESYTMWWSFSKAEQHLKIYPTVLAMNLNWRFTWTYFSKEKNNPK